MHKAILALDRVKARLDEVERQRTEPIAVIGMACRFPGGCTSPEEFFAFLRRGGDAVGRVPRDRWQGAAGDDGDPEQRATRWGGFLHEPIDRFDATFFGISPREAALLDPQHRLLLELTWEALERAGQDPGALVGSDTGVFVGISNNDYVDVCREAGPEGEDVYAATGNGPAFAAGRVSYVFGLQGPSVAVDTACSSSLVAVHLACQSLRQGEASLAIAAGVNLMLSPGKMRLTAATRALSPDGRCKTFDAAANGFVRGEGSGVVVLKRLSEAQRDRDHILATLVGSAVNQDGRSTGLTAPNGTSQQAMLRKALASARVAPENIGFVEAHGTGTSLGDPIEVDALSAVLGRPRMDDAPCWLGAVKSNVGHLEAAAGIAGLIKTVMALEEQVIPKNLHFQALNPRISLTGTPFAIPTVNRPWERGPKPRFAGVSSFGLSGTNAHVIVAEAPVDVAPSSAPREASSYVLPISAKSLEALRALSIAYAETLSKPEPPPLLDIAYTAAVRRAHHNYRAAFVGTSAEEIARSLAAFGANEPGRGGAPANVAAAARPKVVFVFPGQGSQWIGMARQLMREEASFRATIEACDEAIRRLGGVSILDELDADEGRSRLSEISVVQPTLFAIGVALANLWRTWGVEPDAVVGHSLGEVAASRVAGILSLDDAAKVICRRSRLLRRVSGDGAMALVELGLAEAREVVRDYADRLSVAVNNSPRSTVLSGDPRALDAVLAKLEAAGVFSRRIKVDVASHSPQMDPLREDLLTALRNLQPRSARVPMRSTVTGDVLHGSELDAVYWARNLREPVRFGETVERLIDDGLTCFIEMSPHPILLTAIEENLRAKGKEGLALASTRRNADERRTMLESLGALYVRGYPVSWKRFYPSGGRCVLLPTNPWQRERYWVESARPRREEVEVAADEGLYQVTWRAIDRAAPPPRPAVEAAWLLLEDQGGVGAELRRRWIARGEHVVRVSRGRTFARLAQDHYELDPEDPAHQQALMRTLSAEGRAWRGVVHLLGLDATPWAASAAESFGRELEAGFLGVVSCIQALVRSPWAPRPPLWLVTRGAQPAGDSVVSSPTQAAIWALARSASLEHPDLGCRVVDLPPSPTPGDAAELFRELDSHEGRERQIALRAGKRYGARLARTRFDAVPERPVEIVEGATYLITGGLGGLGQSLAKSLVDRGARHLALVGRSAPTAEVERSIRGLEERGARVLVLEADVSRRQDVDAMLERIARHLPPLRGIFHAAGVVGDDVPLADVDEHTLPPVIASKPLAAFHLQAATRDLPLDFLVFYSSASAPLGLVNHAAYAAANSALDAISRSMNALGRPAMSIQWGPFSGAGLAARHGADERMDRGGLESMTPEQGTSSLMRLLSRPRAEIAVMKLSPGRWFEVFPQHRQDPFWSDVRGDAPTVLRDQAYGPPFRSVVVAATAGASRHALLVSHVQAHLATILRLDPTSISPHQSFQTYGFDSLMGLELRNRLQTSLEVPLSMADILTHARCDRLAELLEERLFAPGHASAAPRTEALAPRGGAPAGSWIVTPRPKADAKLRLFCFPYAGGAAHIFSSWPADLPDTVELSAIQPPGRHERLHEPLARRVEEMVAGIVPALLPHLDRPFAMFGHCLGAIVMWEVLRELSTKHRQQATHVFVSGAPSPPRYAVPSVTARAHGELMELLRFIGLADVEALHDDDAARYLLPAVRADFDVAAHYTHADEARLDVGITAFAGGDDPFAPPELVEDWCNRTAGTFSTIVVPGGHYFMVTERDALLHAVSAELLCRLASHAAAKGR